VQASKQASKEASDLTFVSIHPPFQRCPTSFNVQPFTVTIVQSRECRQKLAACMLGPNKARVLQSPLTAVFAADLGGAGEAHTGSIHPFNRLHTRTAHEKKLTHPHPHTDPVKLVPRVQAMERARGLPEAYLSTLPFSVAFLAGQGHMAHAFKDLFTTAMSPLQPMPSVSSLEAWSYKNTAIAACACVRASLPDIYAIHHTDKAASATYSHHITPPT